MKPSSPDQGRRPSVGWVGGDEWELYRPTIQELYQVQNLPLKDVMKIMEDRHGFRATQRMYKTRIKSWGLDKNFKESEVVELFRLRRERERVGKMKSTYMIRGREVDWDRVHSYIRRKGINISHLLNTTPVGPSAREVSCVTPPPPSSSLTQSNIPSAISTTFSPEIMSNNNTMPFKPLNQPPPPQDQYINTNPPSVSSFYSHNHNHPGNLVHVSSPSSSSETEPSFTPSSSSTQQQHQQNSLLLTPISPIPGVPLSTSSSPRRFSHPAPSMPLPPSIQPPIQLSIPPPPPPPPTLLPTLSEFQSLLTSLYETTMFQDGDKTWGTTEYWLRATQSLEWFSAVRYKLALMRSSTPTVRLSSGQWKKFVAYNRAFACIEPLSKNVIGARTWYLVNYLSCFWGEETGDCGKGAGISFLGEVMRVCGYKLVSSVRSSQENKAKSVGEGSDDVEMEVEGGVGGGISFVEEKIGFSESADRFLKAVLEKVVGEEIKIKDLLDGVLMLEDEDGEGYPKLARSLSSSSSSSSSSRRWSDTCLISLPESEEKGLVGVLEVGVKLLAEREEVRAEEKLRVVVEGGFGLGARQEEKVLGRCASYHLSRIYGRRGRGDLARECLMKAVEGSLYFDKFVGWDEVEFLFG